MSPVTAWLAIALALGLAELAAPGVFLVFVALAAAITGLTVLAAPVLPLWGQLVSLALWSVVAVTIGRRWYRDYPVATGTRLNDPAARLIGQDVVAAGEFAGGAGRVTVGDGSWPARGCHARAGDRLRVVAIEGGVLLVEQAPVIPAEAGIQTPSVTCRSRPTASGSPPSRG